MLQPIGECIQMMSMGNSLLAVCINSHKGFLPKAPDADLLAQALDLEPVPHVRSLHRLLLSNNFPVFLATIVIPASHASR